MSIYEKLMKKYRMSCIEIRKDAHITNRFEVVRWYDNPYYNKKDEYEFTGEYYYKPENPYHHIDSSCFNNPEICHTIAYIIMDSDEPKMRDVDTCVIDLTDEDIVIYKKIVRKFLDDFEYRDKDNFDEFN